MSVLKSELKMLAFSEIGNRIDDLLEAEDKAAMRHEGGARACRQLKDAIEGLYAHVDQDVDGGAYELETAALVKRYIARAAQFAQNLAIKEDIDGFTALGRADAYKKNVVLAKEFFDRERQARDAAQAAIEAARLEGQDEDDLRRPKGIKELRLAEERVKPKRGRRARNT